MPSNPGGNPMALGRVNVAASGTPVTVLQNFPSVDTQAERKLLQWTGLVSSVLIKAPAANTGIVYVGTADMVIATGVGVIADIPVGGSISIGQDVLNNIALQDLYLDAATNDDGAYVSALRA